MSSVKEEALDESIDLSVNDPEKSANALKYLTRHNVRLALAKARKLFQEVQNTSSDLYSVKGAEMLKWIVKSLVLDQRNPSLFIEVMPYVVI